MRTTRACLTLTCCLFALTVFAAGQGRKPGLWDLTTVQTWQQSPFPPGMAAGPNSPMGGPHTTQVCLTQQQIDRYGAIVPESRSGSCKLANLVKRTDGMSADWICTGRMSGKGTLESTWSVDGRAKGKVHFVGTMQAGPTPKPVEFTIESNSVFKGADCGSVKPTPMPAN